MSYSHVNKNCAGARFRKRGRYRVYSVYADSARREETRDDSGRERISRCILGGI